jgi:hypothetical protein
LPQVLYAQVVKTVRRRRLVRVRHHVVFGALEAVEQVLSVCGWQIQTAFVERLNLDIRQRVAAVGRRVTTLCKGRTACGSSSPCTRRTTTFACHIAAYASPYRAHDNALLELRW